MKWWNTGSGSGKHSLVRQWRTTKWTPKAGAMPVWPTAAKQGAPRRTLLTTLKSWLPCNCVLSRVLLKTQLLKVKRSECEYLPYSDFSIEFNLK